MRPVTRAALYLVFCCLAAGAPGAARADETDNFTCRARPLRESQEILDDWINERIAESVARANRRGYSCGVSCLARDLEARIGASAPHPAGWVPHARLALSVAVHPGIDRCHVAFSDSIYGRRPYDQPWLFPFTGRVIFLADSIRLSGRIVGIDKINHFLREGLAHWRAVDSGDDIAAVMARELGEPRRQLLMNEHGLKGLSLTGVVSYGDLAASYSGLHFWRDLLSPDAAHAFAGRDPWGRFEVRRRFRFADYVNDAWDEAINLSSFDPLLARDVETALRARGLHLPIADCRSLARLPHAELYVNPMCLQGGPS